MGLQLSHRHPQKSLLFGLFQNDSVACMQKTAFYNESSWQMQGFERKLHQELHHKNMVSSKTQFQIDWETKQNIWGSRGKQRFQKAKKNKNSCWWGGGLCYVQMVEERKTHKWVNHLNGT